MRSFDANPLMSMCDQFNQWRAFQEVNDILNNFPYIILFSTEKNKINYSKEKILWQSFFLPKNKASRFTTASILMEESLLRTHVPPRISLYIEQYLRFRFVSLLQIKTTTASDESKSRCRIG